METVPLQGTSTLQITAWDTVPLTVAFFFTLDGKTAPNTEELVDASLGAAKHKHRWMSQVSLFPSRNSKVSARAGVGVAAWCCVQI